MMEDAPHQFPGGDIQGFGHFLLPGMRRRRQIRPDQLAQQSIPLGILFVVGGWGAPIFLRKDPVVASRRGLFLPPRLSFLIKSFSIE